MNSNSKPPKWLVTSTLGLVGSIIVFVFSLALTHPVPTTQQCLNALHQKYGGTATQDPENASIFYVRKASGEVLKVRTGSKWGPSTEVAQEIPLLPAAQ
jgi:hypothetical protein